MKKAACFDSTESTGGMRNVLRLVAAGKRGEAQGACELATGTVISQKADSADPRWIVELEEQDRLETRLAAGCILMPEVGDTVLLLRVAAGTHYILNVLEKTATSCRLDFPGDVRLSAHRGEVSIQAQEISLIGQKGRLRFSQLEVLAMKLQTHVQQLVSALSSVSLSAGRVTSRIGRALRLTGFELHRAGSVRTEVEGRFTVSSGQTTIVAEQDVTVDASKINLG